MSSERLVISGSCIVPSASLGGVARERVCVCAFAPSRGGEVVVVEVIAVGILIGIAGILRLYLVCGFDKMFRFM